VGRQAPGFLILIEGHWVLSPQSGVSWHRIFFDWLSRYCQVSRDA